MEYLNLDLLFEPKNDAGSYRVRVINSPVGQASGALNPQAVAAKPQDSPEADSTRQFGQMLFNALFSGDLRTNLHRSLDAAGRQGKGLRIRLRQTETPELAALAWEYLHDASRNRTLALSAATPIVRYLDLPESEEPLTVRLPLRALVVMASPSELPPLNGEKEWDQLNRALGPLIERGQIAIERLEEPTLDALLPVLRKREVHIVHFIGHGVFDDRSGEGALVFEDAYGDSVIVSGSRLGTLLQDEKTLRLVVLNACEGARIGEGTFTGVAQRLAQQRIPAVIAMQAPVSDRAAITFDRAFYGSLVDGYPVDAALAEARKAIYAAGNPAEWGLPALFMRTTESRLFSIEQAGSNTPVPLSDPPETSPEIDWQGWRQSARGAAPATAQPPDTYTDELRALREARDRGSLILFLGADLPEAHTGAPPRRALAVELAQQNGLETGQPLSRVAQQVMRHGNRFAFIQFLKQKLMHLQPGPFYQALAAWVTTTRPQMMFTTAYHPLLERALEARGFYGLQTITGDDALGFVDPDQPALVKLYGDVSQTELVVAEQDENALLRGRDPGRREMLAELERAFRRQTVLFLGQDPGDPVTRALFDDVAGGRFQRPAFAVWSGLPDAEVASLASNRGLTVLNVDPIQMLEHLTR